MRICTETARIVLSTFLIIAALAVSLSPLNIECALVAWGVVALGAASSFLIWLLQAHHVPRFTSRVSYIALDLAILSQTASATAHALVAVSLPSPHLPLHNTPGISILYLSLAGIFSFICLWLVLQYEDAGRCWAALLGAGLFSSTLYLRSFAVAEAGPIYGPVFAMALAAIFTQHALRNTHYATGITQQALRNAQQGIRIVSHPAFWYMLFLLSVGLSVLFSPVPGQSLAYWLRLAVLMALSAILSRSVDTPRAWRIAAWGVFLIAGGIPILLSLSKLFSLVPLFGLPSALAYRLHPTELGGANLIARSVLCVLPLALALSSKPLTIPHNAQQATRFVLRASSFMSCAFVGGSAFVILYSQSWEGLFAWLMALGVYGILVYWERVLSLWRSFSSRLAKWGIAVATASLALCVVVSVRAALHLNIYSFNGRLTHWYGAVLAWLDHPWVGSGPGNEAAYAPYTEKVHLWVETQATLDDPLFGVDAEAGRFLRTHSHNLFLEVGSGSGVFSFFTFVGLLVTTFWLGLRTWRLSDGELRLWVAACLAGIVGELAWGSLDVLWVTPPFFSFPVWALIGLLFAAHRFSTSALYSIPPITRAKPFVYCSLSFVYLLLAFLLVLLPALASGHYAAGFTAFQERSWADASSQLERAAFYNPLDSHVHALLAWTYLERGYIEQATSAYERACMLKRGYSPYYSQLGWLVWLGGDVDRATYYFRQAIEQDSGELWREGLHADLGLVYAAQGRYEEAISMFKETIKLNPQMATAPYWRAVYPPPYQGEGRVGELEIVLDPVYIRGPSPELEKRILAHLGASDVTPRLFAPSDMAGSPISLNDVLDTIEEDYREALAANSREAMLLLTVLAEASRAARLYSRAEQAYLEFQSLQPTSAYGFRELGVLYREQGRLAEAQAMLERAVMVSPRDFASRYNLALVYLDQGRLDEAEQVLNIITRQSLTTLFRSPLFDPDLYVAWARLYRARGDLVQAADAQRKISFIRGASADYLALADLYRQLG
ncbi:MAG: tetratricopeptide repeat protein, partial [Candidatus Methanomethylicaceae archaeon]